MNKIIVTTSWDDGDKLDLKLAKLLKKYNLRGTFYIPKKYRNNCLSESELVQLSKDFEIGSHSLSHLKLDEIQEEKVYHEIFESKRYLEKILDKEIKMFCYPKGRFNDYVKKIVKSSGYIGARSVKSFNFEKPSNPFEFNISSCVSPFPLKFIIRNFINNEPSKIFKKFSTVIYYNFYHLKNYNFPLNSLFSWKSLTKNSFDYAQKNGDIFHIYGHSWEIEKYSMWKDLEYVLEYISHRDDAIYLTNSQTLEHNME